MRRRKGRTQERSRSHGLSGREDGDWPRVDRARDVASRAEAIEGLEHEARLVEGGIHRGHESLGVTWSLRELGEGVRAIEEAFEIVDAERVGCGGVELAPGQRRRHRRARSRA